MDAAPRQTSAAEPTREMAALSPRDVAVEEPARPGRSKLLLAAGLAAVLIVGGIAVKVLTSKPTPAAPVSVAPTPVAPAPAPPEVPAPVAAKPVNPAAEIPPPTRRVADAEPKPTAKTRGRAVDDAASAPKSADSEGPHGGFTADQLKAILDKADKLTANGKYEEAIRNYNVVLAADPANGRAKAGKERAVTNMNMP
jgi:hypothetical protein